ncbi:hypothetical protein LOTGIDRAFT_170343 [Lottia gigantea]|uniref:Uncharacterized protein n=1 Tax=Lottia gigantea TaxID=225164 RepID=V4B1H1_LOTGI|nr:hypothetical protein LOTGIDRAFT_170343 [Lottia gigantea]ESO82069.1 hypothetical protein LOTGIDRAFT_170343 [Lottia gigantea]
MSYESSFDFLSDSFPEEVESPLRRLSFFVLGRSSISRSVTELTRSLDRSRQSLNLVSSVKGKDGRKNSIQSLDSSAFLENKRKKFKRHKSLTEMMRAVPKTSTGSSIIRRDGSIVIMKGAKIVSVREDKDFNNGIQDSPILRYTKQSENGRNLQVFGMGKRDLSTVYSNVETDSDDEVFEDSDSDQQYERKPLNNLSIKSGRRDSIFDSVSSEESQGIRLNVSETCFSSVSEPNSTKPLLSNEGGNSIIAIIPLTPHTKYGLAKSDMYLEKDPEKQEPGEFASRNSKTPHRFFPHVDFGKLFPRSASEKKLHLHKSPLLQRRLQNKTGSEPLISPL